ncbi:MAG: PEPxxWA-CTERM sorting domain-containing protein [Polymorphobacter sp.]
MMRSLICTGAAVAALSIAAPAQATSVIRTQVQTLNFVSAEPGSSRQSLQQFQQTGGRVLQSVAIQFAAMKNPFSNMVMVGSRSGDTRMLQSDFLLRSVVNSSAFYLNTNFTSTAVQYLLDGDGTQAMVNLDFVGSSTMNPTNIRPFIGTGSIAILNTFSSLAVLKTTRVGGGSIGSSRFGDRLGSAQMQVVYTFSDPLPEPGTWAMLVVGFGLIGTVMRKRQAATTR